MNVLKCYFFGLVKGNKGKIKSENPRGKNYHIHYHYILRTTRTNGLAGIPAWWNYPVLNEQDWQQHSYIAKFFADIDFANEPFNPIECFAEGADSYVINSDKNMFGGVRSFQKRKCKWAKNKNYQNKISKLKFAAFRI